MRFEADFELEPFQGYTSFDELLGFDTELADEWAGEVSRRSSTYVRWVQSSLNQILGLRLAVDGLLGAQTRSAVRDFQGRQGLAVTGDVDAQTEQRLVTALRASCASLRPCLTLDGFDFDKDRVLPAHQPTIIDLARCVIASQRTTEPIRLIRAVGHTDVEGSPAYNRNLGSNRARQVERHLTETLNRILPGSADGVTILAHTRGEMQPVSSDPARTAASSSSPRSRSRRRRPPVTPAPISSPSTTSGSCRGAPTGASRPTPISAPGSGASAAMTSTR